MVDSLLARNATYVRRLALVYALFDMSPVIKSEHLLAALSLWDYSERSVRYIFGDATGDIVADAISDALRQNGELTRTQMSDLLGRNVSSARIGQALQMLLKLGRVSTEIREGTGRPAEWWIWKGKR
mgnify:CR=1 FL=1